MASPNALIALGVTPVVRPRFQAARSQVCLALSLGGVEIFESGLEESSPERGRSGSATLRPPSQGKPLAVLR